MSLSSKLGVELDRRNAGAEHIVTSRAEHADPRRLRGIAVHDLLRPSSPIHIN
jgi:hypothetical protein